MRCFAIVSLIVVTTAQAQSFTPSGFRDAVNAEQRLNMIKPLAGVARIDDILLDHILSSNVDGKEKVAVKNKTIYGLKLGAKGSEYALKSESQYMMNTPIPGVIRKIVDSKEPKLKMPNALDMGQKGWVFVLIDTSDDTIVGVGVGSLELETSFSTTLQATLLLKCEKKFVFPPSSNQGDPPSNRPRIGEAVGISETGIMMTFTDRKVPFTENDALRLTYIDVDLASKAYKKSIESSGF